MEAPNVYPAPLIVNMIPHVHLPRADCKVFFLRIRIRPYEVGHWTLVRYLAEAVDDFDLVDMMNRGTKPPVNAKYRVVDDHT